MSGTNANAAQLDAEIIGQASPAGRVAQLDAEIVGQASPAAWVAQLLIEVICTAPPLPPRSAREANFPVGFRNWPPAAGRSAWRIAP